MKKILFSSASAILAVVGFSAFKTANSTTTYYWFTSGQLSTNPLFNAPITTADFATGVLSQPLVTTEPSKTCSGSTVYCEFGFTFNQVSLTSAGKHILSVNTTPKTRIAKD